MLREPEVAETKDRGDGGSGTTSQLITRDRRRSNERYQQVPASVTPLSLSHCRPKHARPESTFDARRKITTSYSGRRLRLLLTAAYNMALVPKPSATRELGAKDTCWVRHSPRFVCYRLLQRYSLMRRTPGGHRRSLRWRRATARQPASDSTVISGEIAANIGGLAEAVPGGAAGVSVR